MRNKNLLFRLLLLSMPCLYATQQVLAQNRQDSLLVVSVDSVKGKLVRLPYSTVPANLTSASYDVVYRKDLVKSPVTNVLNALVGRLSGIYTEQGSGQPGSDGVSLSLHGRSPIVLIDGVVRNLTTLDLEEIESVTLLKDAVSTAMLGVRGANGALLITTRRGTPGAQNLSFTVQSGIQQPLHLPQTLNAYDYARLRNEAIDNDLRVRPDLATSLNRLRYSDADIEAYNSHSDRFGHPDVDWQSLLLRKTSMFNRYSFNASGGNNFTKFFVALEHFNQEGLFREDPINKYSTNNSLKGYLARTNVEINITPKLSGGIALLGRIINGNEPAGVVTGTNVSGGTSTIFSTFLTTPNNAYPVNNIDGSYGANSDYTQPNFTNTGLQQASNLQGLATGSGYLQSYRRDILVDFFLKRTLDEVLPGLWVKARGSYSSNLTETFVRLKGFAASRITGQTLTPFGLKIDQRNDNAISTQGRANYAEVSLGYSHTFNKSHGLDVLLLSNRDQSFSGSDLAYTISGASGKVSYNYMEKYVLEAAVGYNGSNRYTGGTKRGFFPALGAAWNITNEEFSKNITWLSNLKLYASYGKAGWDNPGYFSYIQRYPSFTQPIFGTSATGQASIVQGTLAYPDITWEKADKTSIGLSGSVLKNKLGFTIEYYNNKFYDLLITRGRSTSLLGVAYPNENIGINRYKGADFQLSWQDRLGNKFQYYVSANASIQNSEVVYSDEVTQPYDYMRRTGQMVGRPFGYIADGLYQSAAEIASSAIFDNNIPAQPGDIKYRDLNGDGKINQLDVTALGTDKPLTVYGITLGFNFKALDFSALVQGVMNRNIFLTGNRFYEFQNGGLGQAYQEQLDRWTPTHTNASYPRLSIGNNSNNREFSSYWVRSGDYVRLKNIEIGYTLPIGALRRAKISTFRIFANGLNLLTSTKVKGIDPEVYNGSYPLQRVFNFGINIKF